MTSIKQIADHKILDREKEKELILKYKLKGDVKARDYLARHYMKLVISRARIQSKKGMHNITIDDLVSEGTIGLLTAIDKYDPNRLLIGEGLRLGTYAVWWIDAYIKPAAVNNISIIHKMNKNRTKAIFSNLAKVLKMRGFDHPLSHEQLLIVAEDLDCKPEDVLMVETLRLGEVNLDTPIKNSPGDGDIVLGDAIEDPNANKEHEVDNQLDIEKVKKIFEACCGKLSSRDKQILNDSMFDPDNNSINILSEKYGVSKERVRQIQNKNKDIILNRMRKELCVKRVA